MAVLEIEIGGIGNGEIGKSEQLNKRTIEHLNKRTSEPLNAHFDRLSGQNIERVAIEPLNA